MIGVGPMLRRGRTPAEPTLLLLLLLVAVALTACARSAVEAPPGPAPDQPLRDAALALDRADYVRAERALRSLARRCESGADGRRAVLLLASIQLDPRNPDGSPAAAAQLAARYLLMPDAPPSTLGQAESLYLLALDLGASPIADPLAPIPAFSRDQRARRLTGGWRVAPRFGACDRAGPAVVGRTLPTHPGIPLWEALESVWAERDSLRANHTRMERLSEEAEAELLRTRERADSLQAELDRIRELLRGGVEAPASPGGR